MTNDPIETIREALDASCNDCFYDDEEGEWQDCSCSGLVAQALAALEQMKALRDAADNAHGILQYNLGDVDPSRI